ncbi:ABC transporter permease [Coralliovum pocilloporae]|uniref:ABC transporter permease n=1 Tax=Coralliovum pocilloporae TaxID=3066369 RepID=UPI0033073791
MIRRILTICQAELTLRRRNFWVVMAISVLTLFALVLGLAGAAPAGARDVTHLLATTVSLTNLSVYLVPLLALLLSFDGLSGEAERGTLLLLLTYPLKRGELIIGKFLGHLLILSVAILFAYGLVGGLIALKSGTLDGVDHMLRLIWTSVMLGAAFLALGALISASTRQTGTAAGLSVGFWLLFVVLYDIGLLGGLVADNGGTFTKTVFPWMLVANPADSFRLFNMAMVETGELATGLDAISATFPLPLWLAVASLVTWTIGGLLGAAALFRRIEP